MTPHELATAAVSMGYRQLGNSAIWAKPFGYTMILIHTDKGEMEQVFQDAHDKTSCWTREAFKSVEDMGEADDQIKYFECWSVKSQFQCGTSHKFNFMSTGEHPQITEVLDG